MIVAKTVWSYALEIDMTLGLHLSNRQTETLVKLISEDPERISREFMLLTKKKVLYKIYTMENQV